MARRTGIIASITLLFACAFTAVPVKAGTDTKIYPGSVCQPYDHNDDTYARYTKHETDAGDLGGEIENNYNYEVDYICPAVNDVGGAIQTTSWVYVVDNNANVGADVECTIVSHQTTGESRYYDSTSSSGSSSSPQACDFDRTSAYSTGYIYMHCLVPESTGTPSKIVSFKVDEET